VSNIKRCTRVHLLTQSEAASCSCLISGWHISVYTDLYIHPMGCDTLLYASKWDNTILVLLDGQEWAYKTTQQIQVTKPPLSTKTVVNSNSNYTHLDTVYTFTLFMARTWQQNRFCWWQVETLEFLRGSKLQRLPITMCTNILFLHPTLQERWLILLLHSSLSKGNRFIR
jgi:hypothetical protein